MDKYKPRERKRSRSPADHDRRLKVRRRSHSPPPRADFSFIDYKRELNKIISYSNEANTVANSLDDFWIFVKKYEATMKKAGKPVIDTANLGQRDHNDIGIPITFSKFDCINFTTKIKFMDSVYEDRSKRKLDKTIFEAFLNIVSVYLDFKNKEKFEKLKKLRKAQHDLPVAKYR